MADLVLWKPAFFGAKPEIIVKGGQIAWAQMGMPNASIPTPQPVKQRKQFGAYGKAVARNAVIFVAKVSAKEVFTWYSRFSCGVHDVLKVIRMESFRINCLIPCPAFSSSISWMLSV